MTSMGPTFDGAHNRILALSARASLQEYYLHPVGRYQLQCLESLLKLLDFSDLHHFSLDLSFKVKTYQFSQIHLISKPFRSACQLLSHIDQPGSSLYIYEQSDLLSIHYLWSLLRVPTLTEHFLYKQPADQKWMPDQVAVLCFAVGNGEMYRLAKQSSTLTVEQAKQRKKEVQSLDKWIWISQKFSTQTIQFDSEKWPFSWQLVWRNNSDL